MPTYNAAKHLGAAIESVLAQTFRDFAFVIVDDGSTDDTLEIVRRYAARDSRIAVHGCEHRGISGTLNYALGAASTEWVAIMHADDTMQPSRLERQLAFVAANPDIAVASSFVNYISGQGRKIGQFRSELTTRAAVAATLDRGHSIGFHHPAVIMRKSVAAAVGGYRDKMDGCEDLDLWTRIAREGHCVLVQPEFLLNYRIHEGSLSVRKHRMTTLLNEYVQFNLRRYKEGVPEVSLDEFFDSLARMPFWQRCMHERCLWGDHFFKRSAVNYANGRIIAFLGSMVCAILLRPGMTLAKVAAKFHWAGAIS